MSARSDTYAPIFRSALRRDTPFREECMFLWPGVRKSSESLFRGRYQLKAASDTPDALPTEIQNHYQ